MTDVDAGRAAPDRIRARAGLDRTVGLLAEGYPFLAERRRRWGWGQGDAAVELRLLGERVVCVGGPEGARLFYDPERFRRRDAIPRPLARTLFGNNAVHLQDGQVHRQREAMLLGLLDPAAARQIAAVVDRLWQVALDRWRDGRPVVVFDEAVRVFGVAICGWAGLPLTPENARRRVWDLTQIVDYGTNHDPEFWPDPQVFDPTRFLGVEPDRFAFVPHGGGDPATGHRCPGERVTVELLKGAVRVLAGLSYQLPDQDLRYPLGRMPTRLRSGFVITDVRPA